MSQAPNMPQVEPTTLTPGCSPWLSISGVAPPPSQVPKPEIWVLTSTPLFSHFPFPCPCDPKVQTGLPLSLFLAILALVQACIISIWNQLVSLTPVCPLSNLSSICAAARELFLKHKSDYAHLCFKILATALWLKDKPKSK